ncbi:MAG: hypothetical protein FWG64_14830 [Firmicutes bacterium]|nr:hypothetical protein [Bacillota bacterium]
MNGKKFFTAIMALMLVFTMILPTVTFANADDFLENPVLEEVTELEETETTVDENYIEYETEEIFEKPILEEITELEEPETTVDQNYIEYETEETVENQLSEEITEQVESVPMELQHRELNIENVVAPFAANATLEVDILVDELNGENAPVAINVDNLLGNTFEDVTIPQNSVTYPFETSTRTVRFNTNPNNAYIVDNSLFGLWLTNISSADESWYAFVAPENTKLTVALEQPMYGVYAVVLYRLDGNMLNAVAISAYYTTDVLQQVSYLVPTTNMYFLQLVPLAPVNGLYNFIIHTSTDFDNSEFDDNALDAREHTLPFTANQTLDSPLDVDWFAFTTGDSDLLNVTLSNVPNGATYAVYLYDYNLNLLAAFASANEETRIWQLPQNTTFYIEVRSLNGGYSATSSYSLSVVEENLALPEPEVKNGKLYIDGVALNFNGLYIHRTARTFPTSNNSYTSRQESIFSTGNTVVVAKVPNAIGPYTGAVLSDPVWTDISSDRAIIVLVSGIGALYQYFQYFNTHLDIWYAEDFESPGVTIGGPPYTPMVVDIATGQVIDFPEINVLYRRYGHTPYMNGAPILR